MVTHEVGLQDVRRGRARSRLRLLAPLRYLTIYHPEKRRYDIAVPVIVAALSFAAFVFITPPPPIFGENGVLRFARDFLIMAVPFMVGALAAVSMGAPGPHLDRRLVGSPLWLDGEVLTLRQFTCYLLGYLCFLGMITLISVVAATLLKDTIVHWTRELPTVAKGLHLAGVAAMSMLIAPLLVTLFWSLYFLTDVVNRSARANGGQPDVGSTPQP